MSDDAGLPTIILPYPGPAETEGVQDIFIYLRPETNGMLAESTILKVVKAAKAEHHAMELVFLANIPGEFIVRNKIVEQYYALRLHFAAMGKVAFTADMKRKFETHFRQPFENAAIYGAFQALKQMGKNPEELFDTWVANDDVATIAGQCVKKVGSNYIVNYDVPALLHKNSKSTDIAVMLFRTRLDYAEVRGIVANMHAAICGAGILSPRFDAARAFHYSKGPFEQVKDGIAYLMADNRLKLGIEDFTFARWLSKHGVGTRELCEVLLNPIVAIEHDGSTTEEYLFAYTQFKSYEECLALFERIKARREIIHHSALLQNICPCAD